MVKNNLISMQCRKLLMGLVVTLLAGCAAPPVKEAARYVYPPLPSEPHIEYLNRYYSQDDFPKTDAQKASEALLGKPPLDFFRMPNGIASDGKGKVYISDPKLSNIVIFDFVTNKRELLLVGDKLGIMQEPHGLAVDSQSRLFAVDNIAKKIVVFSPQGAPLFVFGGPQFFERPSFLALNERLGRIYVSDGKKSEIVVFDMSGKHLFTFGGLGSDPGRLFGPTGIAIAADNKVYVAEQFNSRIQYFDADGQYLGQFGERGNQEFQLEGPRGLAFDSDQNLHVLDMRQAKWKIFRPDGTLLLIIGASGKSDHPMGFTFPNAIWIDQNDQVYIVDSLLKRFSVWRYLNQKYLAEDPFGLRRKSAR